MTFTKEQKIAAAQSRIWLAEMMLEGELEPLKERSWEIELELARIALASLEAPKQEPVYQACKEAGVWVDIDAQDVDSLRFNGEQIRKVYTAPPAPVSVKIPPEKPHTDGLLADGWNACRAAMLQGKE